MSHNQRQEVFAEFLRSGLKKAAETRSQETLGDRNNYLGATDLVKAKDCERQVVLEKTRPALRDPSLKDLIQLERGHWQEAGLLEAFKAQGSFIIHQLEIVFEDQGQEYRFHLDLVLVSQRKTIIIESKSQKGRAKIYDSFKRQIALQVEAMSRFWSKEAFRVSPNDKPLSFPDLVSKLRGKPISLEPNIEGWVSCIGMDLFKPFGPVLPGDSQQWDEMMALGQKLASLIRSKETQRLRYAPGIYPLCDYCPHLGNCPKYSAVNMEDSAPLLRAFFSIKKEFSDIQTRKKDIETQLKEYYSKVSDALPTEKKHISNSAGSFIVTDSGRKAIIQELLVTALQEIVGLDEDTIGKVVEASTGKTEFNRLTTHEKQDLSKAQGTLVNPAA